MAEHEDPRVSAGYRALGAESPPEALDAAILAASRRAVGARPGWPGFSLRRWAMPMSIAAVVVLAVSVVVRMQLERPGIESPLPMASAPPATVLPQGADEKDARRLARSEAKEEVAALEKKTEAARMLDKAKAVAPSPATASGAAQPAATADAPGVAEGEQRARQVSPAPATPESRPAEKPRFVPEPPARASAESVAAAPPAPAGKLRRDQESGGAREAQVAAAPAAPSVGRAQSLLMAEDRARATAKSTGKKDESPRDWLERIARLRREGRAKEADESLAEFRRRYPDYEIPKELRDAVLGVAR